LPVMAFTMPSAYVMRAATRVGSLSTTMERSVLRLDRAAMFLERAAIFRERPAMFLERAVLRLERAASFGQRS